MIDQRQPKIYYLTLTKLEKNYQEFHHKNYFNFFLHFLVPLGIERKSVKVNPSLTSCLLVFMSHYFITNLYTENDVWFCFDMSEYWLNYAWKKKYVLRQFTFLCKINYMTLKQKLIKTLLESWSELMKRLMSF